MALKYYNEKDYFRSLQLFDELINVYRGTANAEKVYYYYAYCHYYNGDYVLASFHFKNLAETLPNSQYAEESSYMSAYCEYLDSPSYSLDQTNTFNAIRDLQMFINTHPKSLRIEDCNILIDKLRLKLETKYFEIAKLYFYIEDYKAAIVSLKNVVKDFPDTKYKEEILFYLLKANYNYAQKSINSKKFERYTSTIESYNNLYITYPNSKYLKNAENILKVSNKEIKKYQTVN